MVSFILALIADFLAPIFITGFFRRFLQTQVPGWFALTQMVCLDLISQACESESLLHAVNCRVARFYRLQSIAYFFENER